MFILSDDQGAWALGAAGNNEIITPNLDALAAGGVMFNNFFCASPVCSPARASILTGTIPSVHGVHDWLRGGNLSREQISGLTEHPDYGAFSDEHAAIDYLRDFTLYTDILSDNGYDCALSGKWHLGDSMRPRRGYRRWFTIGRGGCEYFNADAVSNGEIYYEKKYITDAITDNALAFLDDFSKQDAPFYLGVHYTSPHSPWDEKNHQQKYLDMYRGCGFETVPDVPRHPWASDTAPRGSGEERRELLRGYFAAVTAMDNNIGRIINKLSKTGRLGDTLIIFTSDNGMNMGHHGIWGKGNGTFPLNMYDTSVKVPFVASHQDKLPHAVRNDLTSHIDIFPTLMEYLGIEYETRTGLIGKSFAGALRGEKGEPNEYVAVFDEYGPVRMIRDKKWKYIHRYPYGPNELYDLNADPGEEANLAGDIKYIDVWERMKNELDRYYARYADPRADGTKEAVSGLGQLRRSGIWSDGKETYKKPK